MSGLILYGPPASGKSTVTRLLERTGEFRLFERLKVGGGRSEEYRPTTEEHLSRLRVDGQLLWENKRYGSTYAVDRDSLNLALEWPAVPVLHVGQPRAIEAIEAAYPPRTWLVVELWADLVDTEARVRDRGDVDLDERVRVWRTTPRLPKADLRFDTSEDTPQFVAQEIRRAFSAT